MMVLFRVEDVLAPLHEIRQRMNDVLLGEIPCSDRSTHSWRRRRQPFILHRNQWQRLLQTYSRILDHIADVLSCILQAPLGALLSTMTSAERSLAECVAPHIHESVVFDRSPSSRNDPNEAQSSAAARIADNDGHDDDDDDGEAHYGAAAAAEGHGDQSETTDLTEVQLTELYHWMVQKALKHALCMEVPCLHLENLLTNSIAVDEALSNYSISTDISFHRELAEEILHTGDAEEEEQVSDSRWWSSGQAEYEDMASAERFFGGQLRQRIGDSSRSIVSLAEFVLQRLRDGWEPTTIRSRSRAVSAAESLARLVVDEAQFSPVIVDGEKMIVGQSITCKVLLKKWMVDEHMVAVKEVEIANDILESEAAAALDEDVVVNVLDKGQFLQARFATEIATQARVRHPNLLPLLCCTQEWRKRHHMVPNMATNLGASVHPYGAAAAQPDSYYGSYMFNMMKVLGLAMERMHFDLEKLINLKKDIIQNRHRRRSAAAAAALPPFPLHVAVDIMLQIAKGMEYLHRHHIMHRDLKPANILVSPDDTDNDRLVSFRVKVADFGNSKSGFYTNVSSNIHTANVGTRIYRAPEVMREDEDTAKYSTKADVYSFAMVCYQILTGKVPFDGEYSLALRNKIRTQHLRPEFHIDHMDNSPSSMSCPMALIDMVRCCWHHYTSARPDFTQIANFLRYMKICTVQMMRAVDDHTQRLPQQQLLGMPLFSMFRSKRLWEMSVESRRFLLELEMGLARDVPTSSDAREINATSTEAGTDVTGRNENRSVWTDSKRRGGAARFIAKIFKAGRPRPTDSAAFLPLLLTDVVPKFTHADIIKITRNFSWRIGEGGFACIYKGTLTNGTQVAVKKAYPHAIQDFFNEVTLLSRIQHRNVIHLIGYCTQKVLVLVLEYMANGSTFDILHGNQTALRNLSWRDRWKIIKGTAQGIDYLHNDCTPSLIHRDIKSSNILIADNMEAKLCDFGLSRTVSDHDKDEVNTVVAGTLGYIDPEYVVYGKQTTKSDIYSFGISMLEIISGRHSIFWDDDGNRWSIVQWVKERLETKAFSEIVDSKLLNSWNNNSSSIRHVLNIAITCVDADPTYRPTIQEIVNDL